MRETEIQIGNSGSHQTFTDHNAVSPPEEVIFGSSPVMEAVRLSVDVAAGANVPILLQGPSGSGKEILARLIHQRSSWGHGTFVKVNCPAIPDTLFESELFGYQRGAFTGAYASKPGRIELAHRGTLFLDEIAELELGLQAKLLQLLQDGQFCRIGGNRNGRLRCALFAQRIGNWKKKSRQAPFVRISSIGLTFWLSNFPVYGSVFAIFLFSRTTFSTNSGDNSTVRSYSVQPIDSRPAEIQLAGKHSGIRKPHQALRYYG